MQNPQHIPVLIAGAGPTGLVMALWLTRVGVKVRLIDKAAAPGTTSRAMLVHTRTLEYYRQLGIAEELVNRGLKFPAANLWVNRKHKARFELGDVGENNSPYPFMVMFPQDQHEAMLIEQLKNLGVEVERGTELISFEQNTDRVQAELKLRSGEIEKCTFDYLVGSDGARSVVRKILGVGFEGSTYPGYFYVADVVGDGPALNGELHASLDRAQFLAIFPMKEVGHARVIGPIKDLDGDSTLKWDDVNPLLLKEMNVNVKEVRWFSSYHVHHRVASHFYEGRVFLAGDAGHIHSPVGGQGMNTGIGDAVNLAWKLADVLKAKANTDIFKSYDTERIAFARQLVSTTDRAFRLVTSPGSIAQFIRTQVMPIVMPFLVQFTFVRRLIFRTLSQTAITYRHCDFNKGRAGKLRGGDRLPWVKSVDNYAPLKSLAWQIHIYGTEARDLPRTDVEVYKFPFNEEMRTKGLVENVAYLIRPDGHIGEIK